MNQVEVANEKDYHRNFCFKALMAREEDLKSWRERAFTKFGVNPINCELYLIGTKFLDSESPRLIYIDNYSIIMISI